MYRRRCLSRRNETTVGSFRPPANGLMVNAQSGLTRASHWSFPTTRRYCECGSGFSGSYESGVYHSCRCCRAIYQVEPPEYLTAVFVVPVDKYTVSCAWRTRPMNRTLALSSFKWPVSWIKKTRNNLLKYLLNVKNYSEHHQVIRKYQHDDS